MRPINTPQPLSHERTWSAVLISRPKRGRQSSLDNHIKLLNYKTSIFHSAYLTCFIITFMLAPHELQVHHTFNAPSAPATNFQYSAHIPHRRHSSRARDKFNLGLGLVFRFVAGAVFHWTRSISLILIIDGNGTPSKRSAITKDHQKSEPGIMVLGIGLGNRLRLGSGFGIG